MRITTIQNAAQHDQDTNLQQVTNLIQTAVDRDNPDMIVLAEHFALRETDIQRRRALAEPIPNGKLYTFLQNQAKQHGFWIHGGSMAEKVGDTYYNTNLVFDPQGAVKARFRKIFLFDYTASDGTKYGESLMNTSGHELVTYEANGLKIGCAICYDLRFPDMFMVYARAGVDVIIVSACFTFNTTRDHWETLIKARAIDTQCYMVGCNQFGTMADGTRPTGGRSCIVDPWGVVTAMASDEVGFATGFIDKNRIASVRQKFQTAQDVRDFSNPPVSFTGGNI